MIDIVYELFKKLIEVSQDLSIHDTTFYLDIIYNHGPRDKVLVAYYSKKFGNICTITGEILYISDPKSIKKLQHCIASYLDRISGLGY